MDFFDKLSDDVIDALPQAKTLALSDKAWNELNHSQVILQRDTAYELKGVGFNLVTEKPLEDEILLSGENLPDIKENRNFARISLISIEKSNEEQELYNLIRKIEYVKYHFFPEGYMIRTASQAQKEAARVSKEGLKNGLNFEKLGGMLLEKYKKIPGVKGVKIIFVTDKNADYKALESIARKNDDITKTLNHIMNSVNFDCDSCGLKAVCDEVEGMREMHFKSSHS